MSAHTDLRAAERFVHANARVLERHRLAVLLRGAPADPVLAALRAYRNPDGGFGHALEPDVRGPGSQPASTLAALELLAEVGGLADPLVADAAAWIEGIALPDGGVPFVLPDALEHPRAPWMEPHPGGSFLTYALAAALWHAGGEPPWRERGTAWCWRALERDEPPEAYAVKFALDFLDAVPDEERARAAIERLRPLIGPDGSVPVAGGTSGERITALRFSARPGLRSRALFTDEQIEADLDRLAGEQQEDGGFVVDFLGWSPGQAVEWRGIATLGALRTLAAHGRVALPAG